MSLTKWKNPLAWLSFHVVLECLSFLEQTNAAHHKMFVKVPSETMYQLALAITWGFLFVCLFVLKTLFWSFSVLWPPHLRMFSFNCSKVAKDFMSSIIFPLWCYAFASQLDAVNPAVHAWLVYRLIVLFLIISGWWFDACGPSNLNGMFYSAGQHHGKINGIKWHYFKGPSYSLRSTTMMIRPLDF